MLEWEREKNKKKKRKPQYIKMAKCQDWLSMFFWASNLLPLLCVDHLKKNEKKEREREKKRKNEWNERKERKKKKKEKKRKKKKEEEWRKKEEGNPECHPSLRKSILV